MGAAVRGGNDSPQGLLAGGQSRIHPGRYRDIEQEMALDLIQRLPKFDSNKAAHTTFVARVIDRKISKVIHHRTQEMRDYRCVSCSLNDLIKDPEGETIERACAIDQDKAEFRIGKRHRTREEENQLRIDVSLALSTLPDDLRTIAEHLESETFTEASGSLGIPRTTLYDVRDRLRRIFEERVCGITCESVRRIGRAPGSNAVDTPCWRGDTK